MSGFRSHRVPASPCPRCGRVLAAALDPIEGAAPRPGDITICIDCGAILTFGEGLSLVAPGPQEEWEIRRQNPALIAFVERRIESRKREV